MEVKANQPTIHKALLALSLADFPPPAETMDRGYGRIELRTTTVINNQIDWPGLGLAFRIDRHVTDLDGQNPSDSVAVGMASLTPDEADAAAIGQIVRGHWGIENREHWVRDMVYDEDRSQVRTANGPRVMATLRNTAMSVLRYHRV